ARPIFRCLSSSTCLCLSYFRLAWSGRSRTSFFLLMTPTPPRSTLFPYTTLFRSHVEQTFGDVPGLAPVPRQVSQFSSRGIVTSRSEEHTSELQSRENLVCRLLLEKKKRNSMIRSASTLLCRPMRTGQDNTTRTAG